MRLRPLLLAAMLTCSTPAFAGASDSAAAPAGVDAEAALERLKAGNARFVAGESTFPNIGEARRCDTTENGQHPIASILSCADSRVPPELVFDAGLGDLFVIRVAGNVAATDEVGTIEYGAAHLGTRLIVVMGHSKCGAVTAVVKRADVGPNIARLVAPIGPAVNEVRAANPSAPEARLVNLSIRENVRRAMHDLITNSADVRALVAAGKVKVVGALYDIHNGTVEWIGEHPQQAALLKAEGGAAAASAHGGPKSEGEGATLITHKVAAAAAKPVTAHAEPEAAHAPKPAATKAAPHGEPARGAKAADAKPAHGGKPARGEDAHGAASHDAHAQPHATATDQAPAAETHDAGSAEHAAAPTLMQRQGLLLPAAFMAAGSALSGTIVYALTGRARAARAALSAPAEQPAESTPAAH